jgi:predicted permease
MWTRRIRYWLSRGKRQEALRAEIEAYLEERVAELQERGLAADAARAQARRSFGNLTAAQEESREIWVARWWQEFWQDARLGARTLVAQPGFAAMTVLALALGIGVNAVLFNLYNGLVLAPWTIREPATAAQVFQERSPGQWTGVSWPQYEALRDGAASLTGLAAFSGSNPRAGYGDAVWTAEVMTVSENFFELIGTGFVAGRGFSGASEVVLQYDTWKKRFGSDPGVLGAWVELSGQRFQVVGVAAPGFNGPSLSATDMWALFRDPRMLANPNACCVSLIGRLKPGVTRASAESEMNLQRPPMPIRLSPPAFLATPSRQQEYSTTFLAMAIASVLTLLLACANVANLQLARAVARRKEMAVRVALGAGRGRLLRQLAAECLLPSVLAGGASLAISAGAAEWLAALHFGPEERIALRFAVDSRVALATVAVALLFGLAPAWLAARQGVAGLRPRSRARPVLLAVQVALCAILLSGAALLGRTVERLRRVDTGFRYEQLLVLATGLDSSGASDEQARPLLAALTERVAGAPGVESVARASVIPYSESFGVRLADGRTKEGVNSGCNEVSAGFFETLRVPLLAGRAFAPADEARMSTAIVNESLAQRLWPGENPIGKQVRILPTLRAERKDLMRPFAVIGVVRNFGGRGFGTESEPYLAIAAPASRRSRLVIRHAGAPGPLASEIGKRARELDRRFLPAAAPYRDRIAAKFRSARVSAAIAGALGTLCLILATVGVYGVAAYNVSQRRREIGIRMALGAHPREILAGVLIGNLRVVCAGAAVGIVGAAISGRLLTGLLYGTPPADPIALAAAVVVLALTSALATWGPASRAAKVDPAMTLRHD